MYIQIYNCINIYNLCIQLYICIYTVPGSQLILTEFFQPSPSTADEENEVMTKAFIIQELVWESCRSPLGSPERQSPLCVMGKTLQIGRGVFTKARFSLFLVIKGRGGMPQDRRSPWGRESVGPTDAI